MTRLNPVKHMLFLVICTTVIKTTKSLAEKIDPTTVRGYSKPIVLDEGDSLSVTCDFENLNMIIYPTDDPINGISTSPFTLTSEKHYKEDDDMWYNLRWTFHRPKVVFGDTGWYSCFGSAYIFFSSLKMPLYSYYVYVKSKDHFFVSTKMNNTLITRIQNEKLTIPCHPTSPDLHVDLINDKTNTTIALNEHNTYDPRVGFEMNFSPDFNGSTFKCRIENNLQVSEMFYHVKVGHFVYNNSIIENKSSYYKFTVVGQTLHINCSFSVPLIYEVDAAWTTPRNMSLRKFREYEQIESNYKNITLELVIENVTITDTGMYTCKLHNIQDDDAKPDILFIEVHDPVEVTTMWEPIADNDDVKLRCDSYISNSTKSIEWLKESELISGNGRINIENVVFNKTNILRFSKRADLNIKQIRKSDIGAYFCRVTHYDDSVTIVGYNITEIYDPMPPKFNDTGTNLNNNTITLIRPIERALALTCHIVGMPPPAVAWYNNGKLFENTSREDEGWNERFITFIFDTEESNITGNYSCVGTNRIGQTNRRNIEIIAIERIKPSLLWISILVSIMSVIIILIIYICCKIYSKKAERKILEEIGLICPDENYLKTLHFNLNVDEQIQYYPYSEKWDFSIKKLKLGKNLGGGEFGFVLKAEAQDIVDENITSTVSVKLVSKKADFIHLRSVVNELKILMYVGKHLNLVNLLGVCTDKIVKKELLLILEHSRFGNVREFLISHRKKFINEVDPETGKIVTFANHSVNSTLTKFDKSGYQSQSQNIEIAKNSKPGWRSKYSGDYDINDVESISTRDLLSWSFQIACAMDHLSCKKVVHGDLALENILLSQNNVVKLCDVGVAKILLADETYKRTHEKNLPFKWMAIESINQTRCSLQSDVWSFGVVLWELFTLAEIPYDGVPSEQLYEKLLSGYRLEMPLYAIKEIYDVMLDSWQEDPNMRPTFTNLVEQTGVLLDETVRTKIIEMIDSYTEKRVQFVSEDIHLNQTSSYLEFENGTNSGTDFNDSTDHFVMETKL